MTERALPPLNPLHARSTYWMLITIAMPLFGLFGIDILAVLGVSDASQAVERLVLIVPTITALAAYLERRNPSYSIDWTKIAKVLK